MTLNDIAISHQSDKGSQGHDYAGLYELLFRGIEVHRILEIGVYLGYSLEVWAQYFPHADIVGVDIEDRGYLPTTARIEVVHADAYSPETLTSVDDHYDIIIDDGSHTTDHQVWFIEHYHQFLNPRGVMLVEDVQSRAALLWLTKAVPGGFRYSVVEMPLGQPTSRLFILWRE